MEKLNQATSRRQFLRNAAMTTLAAGALLSQAPAAEEANAVKVAVLTGGHAYDQPNFQKLFKELEGIQATILPFGKFAEAPEAERDAYDVVLFYTMLMPTPEGKAKEALEHLGATKQGLVVLHHALLSHPKWPVWTEVMGIADRKFGFFHDQKVHVNVVNTTHPITKGIQPWEMIDETYTMADAGEGSEILLTVEHPKSMKTIGWTRQYKKSRVFCFESGHDNQTWVDPNFREVLRRGIFWSAGKQ